MASHVVENLDLRLEGTGLSAADLRSGEALVRAALDRACEIAEGGLRGRRLYVRSLPVSVLLDYGELSSRRGVEDLAAAIAASLLSMVEGATQDEGAPVRVFGSDAQRAAAAARLLAGSREAWFAEEWRTVDECVRSVVEEIGALLEFVEVLASERALGPVLLAASTGAREELREAIREAMRVCAGEAVGRARATGSTPAALTAARVRQSEQVVESILASCGRGSRLLLPPPEHGGASGSEEPVEAGEVRTGVTGARNAPVECGVKEGLADGRSGLVVPTNAAGVFYLLHPALELDVGEVLWRAGVDEGACVAAAARLVASGAPADDPVFRLIGGEGSGGIATERWAEVARGLLGRLAATIERRKLGAPELSVCAARLSGESVMLLGLRPDVPVMGVVEAGAWSGMEKEWRFGCAGRFGPDGDGVPAREVVEEFLACGPDVAWRAVVSGVGGAISALACLRVRRFAGVEPGPVIRAAMATRGDVCVGEEELLVRIDGSGVQMPLRLAGLDRDPGWVPWLKRYVRFEFVADEHGGSA